MAFPARREGRVQRPSGCLPGLLTVFLEETNQMPDDEEVLQMFIYLNVKALERNEA